MVSDAAPTESSAQLLVVSSDVYVTNWAPKHVVSGAATPSNRSFVLVVSNAVRIRPENDRIRELATSNAKFS